jgi:hypothetical protein
MKEKKFHGDYYSPGQGKRPDQYETSGKILVWAFVALVVIIFFLVMKNL